MASIGATCSVGQWNSRATADDPSKIARLASPADPLAGIGWTLPRPGSQPVHTTELPAPQVRISTWPGQTASHYNDTIASGGDPNEENLS